MIGGIILSHGNIASATLAAAENIIGDIDNICTLSTEDFSLKSIIIKLEQILSEKKWDQGVIIMVSLKGGTCWNAAVAVARKLPDIQVVSGVNLTMVLSFIYKRDSFTLSELSATIYNDAKTGIDRFLVT